MDDSAVIPMDNGHEKRDKGRKGNVKTAINMNGYRSTTFDMEKSGYEDCIPRQVFVKVVFMKITDIDTPKEQFIADIFLQSRWKEPALEKDKTYEEAELFDMWNPNLNIQNIISESRDSKWIETLEAKDGELYIVEKRRIKGIFSESMELEHFPFDIQDISLLITTEMSVAEAQITEDEEHLSRILVENFSDEQEWALFDFVECVPRQTTRAFTTSHHKYSSMIARTAARRRGAFFIFNIVCVMLLISSLVLTTFAVPVSFVQNRLQLTFILVLTGIAFKFVSTQSLPKISYLTYLDKYIIGSMLLMYVIAIWHAITTRFDDDASLQQDMDRYAWIVFLVVYLVYQIGFAVFVNISTRMRKKMAKQKETQFQERAKRAMGTKYEQRKFRKSMKQKRKILVVSPDHT